MLLELEKKSLLVGNTLLSLLISDLLGGVSLSWLGSLLGGWRWISANGRVNLLVCLKNSLLVWTTSSETYSNKVVRVESSGNKLGELALVTVLILLLQVGHVVSDMLSKNSVTVSLGVVLLRLLVKSEESALAEN